MVHTVHTNRDKWGRRERERRAVRDRREQEGGQDAMRCALLSLNEEKLLSHIFSPISEIKKKTNKSSKSLLPPHIKKTTLIVENRRNKK